MVQTGGRCGPTVGRSRRADGAARPGRRPLLVRVPRCAPARRPGGFLRCDVGGTVAQTTRIDQTICASSGTRSNRTCSRSASQASQASMPSNTSPSARRCHCSRPHGWVATRRSARSRTSGLGSSSRAPTICTESRSTVARWSATENSQSRSTSSPQRSMRTARRRSPGRRRGWIPAPPARRVLHLVLAAVPDEHQPLDQLGRVDLVARVDLDRLGVLDVRPSRCTSARAGATTTCSVGSAVRSRQSVRTRRPMVSIEGLTRSKAASPMQGTARYSTTAGRRSGRAPGARRRPRSVRRRPGGERRDSAAMPAAAAA